MAVRFTVSDGKLVLFLQPAEKGWYAVTSPFDPGITTQARTVEDAFKMAYDAQKALTAARAKLARTLARGTKQAASSSGKAGLPNLGRGKNPVAKKVKSS
jgi:antitoxin HicB